MVEEIGETGVSTHQTEMEKAESQILVVWFSPGPCGKVSSPAHLIIGPYE